MREKISQWPVQESRSWLVYLCQLSLTQELVQQGNEIEERGRDQILKCYYLIFKICRLPEFLPLETIKCSCSPENLRDKIVTILALRIQLLEPALQWWTVKILSSGGLSQGSRLASCTQVRQMHPIVSLASYTKKLFVTATYLLVW